MELLQQNWGWITSNPWGFATFAVVIFGLGWGAARLFYGERIELLKVRADGASSEVSGKNHPISFSISLAAVTASAY
jgi:hypothetical protein